MWRRLAEGPAGSPRQRRPTNYRRPDFMEKALGQIVRQHAPHPTTPAIDRFVALTERISHIEKPVSVALPTGSQSLGDPFGSPVPQRPQPSDISRRIGEIIYKRKAGLESTSPAGLSLCKFCKPHYRLTSTAACASSAEVPF